jgi:outer membrane protein OmpA-like peptidoglycan-associated protein
MSRFIMLTCIFLMLGVRAPLAEPADNGDLPAPSNLPAAGLGIGAVIGGLIGGPPGAVVGAAGGAWFGTRDAGKDQTIAELETKLENRTLELASLRADFDRAQDDMTVPATRVASRDAQVARGLLSEGFSLPVFFRTDDARVEESLKPHLEHLGKFLQSFPELNVRLEGFTDQRGDDDYNLGLSHRRVAAVRAALENQGVASTRIFERAYGESQARARTDDGEAMAFDRTVIIGLSLQSEVFARSDDSPAATARPVALTSY